jgi:nitrite reductase/ring-hydroxylating ferredoxin subunit
LNELQSEGLGHAVKVSGIQVALFRWEDRLHALEDICPHLGFPLSEGVIQDGEIICGWHGWRINVETGGCRLQRQGARTYPVEIRGDEVWIEI